MSEGPAISIRNLVKRYAAGGGLSATGETVRVGSPVCILFKTA